MLSLIFSDSSQNAMQPTSLHFIPLMQQLQPNATILAKGYEQ